ncbi:MAG TPA: DMT family transporter [Caulobacterales bacterium]|nr:DMT family transporter [Caulobacterales bacterium]
MPPLAIALALTSAIIHASWNAVLKRGGDRVTDSFLVGVGGAVLGVAGIAMLGAPPAATWPFLLLSTVIHTLYWFTLFKGYDAGDLSHVYTLSRGSAPLLVALGAALAAHEIPAGQELLGIAMVSAGVLSVGISPRAPLEATFWAVSIGLCIAAYSLVDALGARSAGNAALYISWNQTLMSLPLAIFAVWRRGPRRLWRDSKRGPWRGLLVGAVGMIGYGLVLWAQTMAPIAQTTALRETSVVFGAIIAWLFMRERVGPRRALGACLAAAGAATIAFGG